MTVHLESNLAGFFVLMQRRNVPSLLRLQVPNRVFKAAADFAELSLVVIFQPKLHLSQSATGLHLSINDLV
jgi:hypothetical protein